MKLGASFSDSIHTEKLSKRSYSFSDKSGTPLRGFLFPFLMILLGCILIGRLFWLQIVEGSYYRNLSDSNRIRTSVIHAPRGIIFDRNGTPLVFNTPGYRKIENNKPILLSASDGIADLARGDKNITIDSLRQYPLGEDGAHVVGYIGQISPQDLKNPLFQEYLPTDLVGKMGVESSYESLLKGVDGKVLTEVDAMGKKVRTLGQTDPLPGQNITLTIDSTIQKEVFAAMKGVKKGAAIVSTPDGQILALVSKPSFDPNLFTMGKSYIPCHSGEQSDSRIDSGQARMTGMENCEYQTISQVLLDGDGQPLLDRAIAGVYPPGSTFKLVTAAAGLETNTIDQNYTIDDEGILRIGDFSFANWYFTDYGGVEGTVDVVKAIKRSNDIFFYKLGSLLGVDKLSGEAEKFGLGSALGIQLDGEAAGLVPTKAWKQKTFGEQWYTGDDYHYGIGQGYLLTTPLQVNAWTQVIANGGTLYQPTLIKDEGLRIKDKGLLTDKNRQLIRQGMIEACDTGGVAWPLFNFSVNNTKLKVDGQDFYTPETATSSGQIGVRIACKTGTAQHGGETTLPHSWITLFAPAYHPQIVVTILSESSGEGSNIAGPIAKEILTKYFEK